MSPCLLVDQKKQFDRFSFRGLFYRLEHFLKYISRFHTVGETYWSVSALARAKGLNPRPPPPPPKDTEKEEGWRAEVVNERDDEEEQEQEKGEFGT